MLRPSQTLSSLQANTPTHKHTSRHETCAPFVALSGW